MWYVYIVECADATLYTWITTNLNRRIRQHNWELVWWAKYTRLRNPVKLVYNEILENRSEASKREYEIKKYSREKKIELINTKNMQKIVYLIPPSEGKKSENKYNEESLHYNFNKPFSIAKNVTEKDLKCSWKRYEEWLELNKQLCCPPPSPLSCREGEWLFIQAIDRYSWVMFNAIDYKNMSDSWKQYFEEHFLILSWMYGIVKPLDTIWNYKLPIETKWLLDFWWTKIIEELNKMWVDKVVNLLPDSYAKLIYWKNKTQAKIFAELRNFEIEDKIFYKEDWKKMAHWVKKVKGEWIKELCERN